MPMTFATTTGTPEQLAADLGIALEPTAEHKTPTDGISFSEVTPDGVITSTDGTAAAPAPAAAPKDGESIPPKAGTSDQPGEAHSDDDDKEAREGYTPEEWAALAEKTRRRIAKLTKQRRTAESERDQLRQAQAAPAPKATPEPTPSDPATHKVDEPPAPETPAEVPVNKWVPEGFRARPTLEEFDFDAEAHDDALDEWRAELREARAKESQRRTDAKVAADKAVLDAQAARARFGEAVAAVKARVDDWDATTAAVVPQFQHPQQVRDFDAFIGTVTDGEGHLLGPDILYHLAKHPDALARVTSAQGPAQMAMALGAVAYTVEQARAPRGDSEAPPVPPKPQTKAPAPITRTAGVAVATDDLNEEGISQTEWERRREAQLRRASG